MKSRGARLHPFVVLARYFHGKRLSSNSPGNSDQIREINGEALVDLPMENTEKLLNQIMELKFTSKLLQRQARKCENEEKTDKLRVKKAMEKGNMDGARIYAENAIRKRTEQLNCLRLASRLDAVVARLDTQAKITTINKSVASLVKSLESSLASGTGIPLSEEGVLQPAVKNMRNCRVNCDFSPPVTSAARTFRIIVV